MGLVGLAVPKEALQVGSDGVVNEYYLTQSIKNLTLFKQTGDVEHFNDAEYFFKRLKLELRLNEKYQKIEKLKKPTSGN